MARVQKGRFTADVSSLGDDVIWHETCRVRTADIETSYGSMPPHGLAADASTCP